MTDKPTDAVAQAREMAKQASLGHKRFCVGIHDYGELGSEEEWVSWDDAFASLIVALRAECTAKVRAVPTIGNTPSDAQFFADKMRDKILAALEAQP